jgi:hypothetical protein
MSQPECAQPAVTTGTLVELAGRHEQRRHCQHYEQVLDDAHQLQLPQPTLIEAFAAAIVADQQFDAECRARARNR